MMAPEEFLDRFEKVRRLGDDKWQARCPSHDDRTPSLSVALTPERWLLYCQAGCPTEQVVADAGLEMGDLFAENGNGHREVIDTYDYTDERGELLFQVVRFAPKDFRQRRPDGVGGWEWRLGDTRRVLYRLPRVLEAVQRGERVYVAEGERDVHSLEKLGLTATCNAGGALKWRSEHSNALRGAEVVVIADRDDAGREHAKQVAESLQGVAADVEVVEPATGKDAADHLTAGRGLDDFVPLVISGEPKGRRAPAHLSGRFAHIGWSGSIASVYRCADSQSLPARRGSASRPSRTDICQRG
jgi:5S rRNA maturation endonuclease (ribonuclease M5)